MGLRWRWVHGALAAFAFCEQIAASLDCVWTCRVSSITSPRLAWFCLEALTACTEVHRMSNGAVTKDNNDNHDQSRGLFPRPECPVLPPEAKGDGDWRVTGERATASASVSLVADGG